VISVEVRNFQSVEHATIKIDGFTALVGRSNIGKSAVVRAIKAALTGASGTSFVRHGPACARRLKKAKTCECYTSVHLVTEGFDLKWKKGDKFNQYVFNGQTYDRTETGTPDFLLSPQLAMGFDMVDIARKAKLLQVADQFDNVFLLDQTGGAVADVLSDVARLDRINVALRLVEKDRKEASSTRKVYEKEAVENKTKLEAFNGLDKVVDSVRIVEVALDVIGAGQTDLQKLSGYLEELQTLGFRIDELQQACNVTIPDADTVAEKQRSVAKLTTYCAQANEKAAVIRALSGVEDVVEPVLSPVEEQAAKYLALNEWVTRLKSFQDAFSKTQPSLVTLDAMVVPDIAPLIDVRAKYLSVERLHRGYTNGAAAVTKLEADYKAACADAQIVDDEARELGVCPTCTQSVQIPHTHEKVA
jgi:hypothetical protein